MFDLGKDQSELPLSMDLLSDEQKQNLVGVLIKINDKKTFEVRDMKIMMDFHINSHLSDFSL